MKRARSLDGPTPLQWLLREIELMPGCSITKASIMTKLRAAAGQRLYLARRELVSPYRVSQAVQLLDTGMARQEARSRVEQRFGVSRVTACRIVARAILMRASSASAPAATRGLQLELVMDDED